MGLARRRGAADVEVRDPSPSPALTVEFVAFATDGAARFFEPFADPLEMQNGIAQRGAASWGGPMGRTRDILCLDVVLDDPDHPRRWFSEFQNAAELIARSKLQLAACAPHLRRDSSPSHALE